MNRPLCIYKTKTGKVLVGRTDGIYDATSGKQVAMDVLRNNAIHSIAQTREGKLVVGTSNRICVISNNKIESEITPVYETKSTTFQLSGEKPIRNIIADDYGRIWFTSYPHENLYLLENGKLYDVFDVLDIPRHLLIVFTKTISRIYG